MMPKTAIVEIGKKSKVYTSIISTRPSTIGKHLPSLFKHFNERHVPASNLVKPKNPTPLGNRPPLRSQ